MRGTAASVEQRRRNDAPGVELVEHRRPSNRKRPSGDDRPSGQLTMRRFALAMLAFLIFSSAALMLSLALPASDTPAESSERSLSIEVQMPGSAAPNVSAVRRELPAPDISVRRESPTPPREAQSASPFYRPPEDSRKLMFFHRARTLEAGGYGLPKDGYAEAITVTTQLSVDRIDKRLYDMVREWDGPMSITVYLRSTSDIAAVNNALNMSESLAALADVHLYIEGSKSLSAERRRLKLPPPFPINVLRNMALDGVKQRAIQAQVRAPWILVVDADARITGNMREATRQLRSILAFGEGPPRHHGFDEQRTVFVVPAFSRAQGDPLVPLSVTNKHDLRDYLFRGEAEIMHATSFPISYLGSMDLWRWTFATEPYHVRYTHRWEPYYIARMGGNFPYFDERFVDRGLNKAQQQFALFARDYRYVIMPDTFVVDTPMPVSGKGKGFRPVARGYHAPAAIAKSYLHFNNTYLESVWRTFVTDTMRAENLTCDRRVAKRNRAIYMPRCTSSTDPSNILGKSAHFQPKKWSDVGGAALYRSCSTHHPHVVFFSYMTLGNRLRDPARVLPADARGVRPADLFGAAHKSNNFRLELFRDSSKYATMEDRLFDPSTEQSVGAHGLFQDLMSRDPKQARTLLELDGMDKEELKKSFEATMECFLSQPESIEDVLHNPRKKNSPTEEVATAAWHIYKLFNNTVRLLYEHPFRVLERTLRQSPITYISIVDPVHVTHAFQYKQLLRNLRLHNPAYAGQDSPLRNQCGLAVDALKSRGEAVPPLGNEKALHYLLSACIPANPLVTFFCGRGYDCDVVSFPEEKGNSRHWRDRREATLRRAKDGARNEYLVVGLSDDPSSGSPGNLLRTTRVLGKLLPSFFGGVAEDPDFKLSIDDRQQRARELSESGAESGAAGVPPEVRTFLASRSSYDAQLYGFLRERFVEQENSCRNS